MISKEAKVYIEQRYEADKVRSDKSLSLDWKQYAGKASDLASIEMKQKAIESFDASCSDCGQPLACEDCEFRKKFINNLDR